MKVTERVSGWIPVWEEMPFAECGESDSVLCATELGVMKVLYFDGGVWCWPTGETYEGPKIAFWRALPPTPMDDTGIDKPDYSHATMEVVDSQPYFKKHYRKLCCSNCKREVLKTWSFCPVCGAKFMKEKKT